VDDCDEVGLGIMGEGFYGEGTRRGEWIASVWTVIYSGRVPYE
jgi:hypothetical protein